MKFSGMVGNGPVATEQMVKFGGDPDHRLDTGIVYSFSGFVTVGRYGKWLQQQQQRRPFYGPLSGTTRVSR